MGIAGMINPNPTATRNEIEVRTETSLGSPLKGELNRIFIPSFSRALRRRHLGERWHVQRYLGAVFLRV